MAKISGTDYVAVDGLGYDATNKKLMLKVGASTEPIPFSSGSVSYWLVENSERGKLQLFIMKPSEHKCGAILNAWNTNYEDEYLKYAPKNTTSGGVVTLKKSAYVYYRRAYNYTDNIESFITHFDVGDSIPIRGNSPENYGILAFSFD